MTTTDASPARPIRLVYCDESGCSTNMKAIRWNAIFSIVYVVGFSLIMRNMDVFSCSFAMLGIAMLLGTSSGFQVASTHPPCTKGLWLWSTPLRRTALDGTGYNLLLIDSEGID
ncbi:guanylate-binding family protein [Artemisia annua]|uniref:Guanylate-binding family protein n=1 Tax=Artemisia annua TaxID=35608 RepID=A0A2U1K8P2_ARTAN|nr:guanylate-binding family protein [Artemisia annua]